MYKENVEILAYDYGKRLVNMETHAMKEWESFKYYFDCSKCEKQSICDEENTLYSCNNFLEIEDMVQTRTGKSKIYCGNYKKNILEK